MIRYDNNQTKLDIRFSQIESFILNLKKNVPSL